MGCSQKLKKIKHIPSPEHLLIAVAKKELAELKRKAHSQEPGASAYISNSEMLMVMNEIAGMRRMAKFEGL